MLRGDLEFGDSTSATTTFIMPAEEVVKTANYIDVFVENDENTPKTDDDFPIIFWFAFITLSVVGFIYFIYKKNHNLK